MAYESGVSWVFAPGPVWEGPGQAKNEKYKSCES